MNPTDRFAQAIAALPLIAILRGLQPDEAVPIGEALVGQGWQLIEVPLNSPDPLRSIERLCAALPTALVGAGTVLTAQQVREVHAAGGQLVVSPNVDAAVIDAALQRGMVCLPGIATATEAFAALAAGAQGLKLFPAELVTPAVLKALRAVLPVDTVLLPVGGIVPAVMALYRAAGANGFGLGSALYRPGLGPAQVSEAARVFIAAWRGVEAV